LVDRKLWRRRHRGFPAIPISLATSPPLSSGRPLEASVARPTKAGGEETKSEESEKQTNDD
jgi:hypothetical protein